MSNDAPLLLILAGVVAGFVVGALLAWLGLRARVARAHAEGRASRDAEIATLAGQRDAEARRAAESAARVERYEHDGALAEQNLRKVTAHAAAQQAQAERLARELDEARRLRDEAQARLVELTGRHAALEARSAAQAHAAAEKLQLLEQAEVRLREAFQNLAQGILDDKAERFREQSGQQLSGLLDPFKLQLKEFRETVELRHASDQRERGMLAQEIHSLRQLNQRISEDALNLTRALKGDTRAQGAWGELVLERVLEASGLSEGREFELQRVLADEDGGRPRPDVIVHLPERKDLVVDAKVSLTAYERMQSTVDDGERDALLREHVASLRRHVDSLSRKKYDSLPGLNTLDFVLLFVPIEAALIEAVRADDGLYTYALSKNISLVCPSTLLATLRTVSHLWRLEDRNVNAMQIAKQAGALHDSFVMLVNELHGVGDALTRAQALHEGALKRIGSGRGNLLARIDQLRRLGADTRKQLSLLPDDTRADTDAETGNDEAE
ncbi:DNA recombination protein RmuC [Dokdonella sp.]|uniref:DNA recombination protein RmuC n=1 Tax=Dokdonella sp. TaxID=2291710 RepID=UPI002F3F3E98